MQPLDRLRVAGSFAAGVAGISFAAIFVRLAQPAPPVTVAFYRMAIASALLGSALALTSRRSRVGDRLVSYGTKARAPVRAALLAGLFIGADLALWHEAIVATSLANATLLVNTTPVYVGLYAVLVEGQRLAPRFLVGAALAIAGCALLLGLDAMAGSVAGSGLALAAALFYSGYLIVMKRAREVLPAVQAVFLASIAAAVLTGALCLLLGEPLRGFPASSWGAMLGAAVVAQIGGIFGIIWALRYLPAAFVAVALLAQPVGTSLLGWWLLDEGLSRLQLAGGSAVLAGIAIASLATSTAAGSTPGEGAQSRVQN